jgi:hypothetical protein
VPPLEQDHLDWTPAPMNFRGGMILPFDEIFVLTGGGILTMVDEFFDFVFVVGWHGGYC